MVFKYSHDLLNGYSANFNLAGEDELIETIEKISKLPDTEEEQKSIVKETVLKLIIERLIKELYNPDKRLKRTEEEAADEDSDLENEDTQCSEDENAVMKSNQL